MRRLIACCVLLMLAACGSTSTGTNGGIIPPIFGPPGPKTAWENYPDAKVWTAAAQAAVDGQPALLAVTPKGMDAFCPRFATAEPVSKRDFWVVTLAEIAYVESGLNASATKAVPGTSEVRRGMFQISIEAARRYGCAATTGTQLADPIESINCAAKILAQTSGQDGYVAGYDSGWRGAARYWLTLRTPDGIAQVQSRTNAQGFCPVPRKTS